MSGGVAGEAGATRYLCDESTFLLSSVDVPVVSQIVAASEEVELFKVLITRNLLILGTATTAKKAPLPDPLYVYCTKRFLSSVVSQTPLSDHSIPID
jgi:hypothetical protein